MKKIIALPAILISFVLGAVLSHEMLSSNIEDVKVQIQGVKDIMKLRVKQIEGEKLLKSISLENKLLETLIEIDKKGTPITAEIRGTAEKLNTNIDNYENELRSIEDLDIKNDIELFWLNIPDTLIKDNPYQLLECHYGTKAYQQAVSKRVQRRGGSPCERSRLHRR